MPIDIPLRKNAGTLSSSISVPFLFCVIIAFVFTISIVEYHFCGISIMDECAWP